jgi:hypothetical protein
MSFWADAINGSQTQVPVRPVPRGLYTFNNPVEQDYPFSPPQETYIPSVRMTQGSICPGCGSDRYRGSIGDRAVACSECGYHPRFEQSGYGTRSLSSKPGEATPARQVASTQTMRGSIAELNAGGGVHI